MLFRLYSNSCYFYYGFHLSNGFCFSPIFHPPFKPCISFLRSFVKENMLSTTSWSPFRILCLNSFCGDLGNFCLIYFSASKRLSDTFSLNIHSFYWSSSYLTIPLSVCLSIYVCIKQGRNLNIQNSDIQKHNFILYRWPPTGLSLSVCTV